MKIYQPQSKNVMTVAWGAAFALIGTAAVSILDRAGFHMYSGPSLVKPYVGALFPLLMAGVPVLLLTSFIFAVYSIGREEDNLGRYQLAVLMVIILALAYTFSFIMTNGGGF